MPKAKVYNWDGSMKEEIELPKEVFGVAVKRELLHRVLTARASSRRTVLAEARTRGEVRGGGRKPWRQKGTGRARHSSIRSPIWKGGGVVFGPSADRQWGRKVNVKALKAALASALTSKFKSKKLTLVSELVIESAKTKLFMQAWKAFAKVVEGVKDAKVGTRKKGNELLMIADAARVAVMNRASRNIPGVKVASAQDVPLEDIIGYRYVVLESAAIPTLVKRCKAK